MISQNSFDIIVIAWIGLAILMIPLLLKIIVPYGRHSSSNWGPKINNRIGWFLMEITVIVIFSWLFFSGNSVKSGPLYIIYGLFMIHYNNIK